MNKLGFLMLLVAGLCAAQTASSPPPEASQTPEAKIVQDLFGQQLAQADKGKLSDDEALTLTGRMLAASCDATVTPKLKAALSAAALRVAVGIGTDESARLSRRALDVVQSIDPIRDALKAYYLKEIPARRVAKARTGKHTPEELQNLAKKAMESSITYVETTMTDDESASDISAAIRQMRNWILQYKLKEYSASVDDLEKQVRAANLKRSRLRDALARLEPARTGPDPGAVAAASKAVAMVYLEVDGDFRSAAKYFGDDPRGKPIVATVRMLEDPKSLDNKKAMDTIEALVRVIDGLGEVAKLNACKTALQLAGAVLKNKPSETTAAKVKLAMVQWQAVTGVSEGERLKKQLADVYGTIQGKLEVLEGHRVRLTYEFANPAELKDWEIINGTWDIGKNTLACRTGEDKIGQISCRLPFRQDKPFRIIFAGAGRHELTGKVVVSSFRDGKEMMVGFKLVDEEAVCVNFQREWRNDRIRLHSDKATKFEIASEGDGKIAWALNGTDVTTFRVDKDNEKQFRGAFRLLLQTKSADRGLTMFDGVMIEGEILPEPDAVPDEYKKKKDKDKGGN